MPERSQDRIKQALRDIESAQIQEENGFYEWACFIAHQASEKALKSVYQKMGGVVWGHSLSDLLKGLADQISIPQNITQAARSLEIFYIPTRYPDGWSSGSPADYFFIEDASNAIDHSRKIVQFCKSILAG
ncbi:MAG: HEPN domain-containing protein [Candidatus Atribacteria bacterium]|nr:HEPN domain-containing protein [Candidatus Atribacteria bacterium]